MYVCDDGNGALKWNENGNSENKSYTIQKWTTRTSDSKSAYLSIIVLVFF